MIYMAKKVPSQFVPTFHFRTPDQNSYTNHTKDLYMVSECFISWQINNSKDAIIYVLIIHLLTKICMTTDSHQFVDDMLME